MAITYTYTVTQLIIAPSMDELSDVVTGVRYNYTGVDDRGYTAVFAGATPVPPPTPDTPFIPFADLTEAEVVSWLESAVDPSHMQEVIVKNIENQISPKNEPVDPPWGSSPSTPTPNN